MKKTGLTLVIAAVLTGCSSHDIENSGAKTELDTPRIVAGDYFRKYEKANRKRTRDEQQGSASDTESNGSDASGESTDTTQADSNQQDLTQPDTTETDTGAGVTDAQLNQTCPYPQELQEIMLAAVNQARAQARMCGSQQMPAVGPLAWNMQLGAAAESHSANMANYGFFNHTDLSGANVADRVSAQGYQWRAVGENIAAGYPSVAAAMEGWLGSAGHCANIMSANFTEMGSACEQNDSATINGANYRYFWTQVFASPR